VQTYAWMDTHVHPKSKQAHRVSACTHKPHEIKIKYTTGRQDDYVNYHRRGGEKDRRRERRRQGRGLSVEGGADEKKLS